ncbi:hypothetical protein AGR4C_Cc80461 [Agrobacterium tumefaciens str. Kerr 14]|uniref:Uncharacterized protein n=1 Tax=Agrobacterium tumefaciens str. Kerr 14 TaxID=1183424 RepID=A0A1S7QT58_AGRTU|nr:hypothetical protein AGR4C_Cc80461 [Agrobacterium tumefaciens str. Kerr 14]
MAAVKSDNARAEPVRSDILVPWQIKGAPEEPGRHGKSGGQWFGSDEATSERRTIPERPRSATGANHAAQGAR